MIDSVTQRRIYTVSKLTREIKVLLEDSFPLIWLSGEISNFSRPVSGHYYFTLKDENCQISAVMFRGQGRNLTFVPEDGMKIVGLGRISVYEPRGTYQVIFEYLEPHGVGALQIAFEQLKSKLSAEGLFDDRFKKPIPFLPCKISVVTSPTGAVIHDILRVIGRRFPNTHIEIAPVKVQGDGAEDEIVAALNLINSRADSDVIILARGGGSLEDLQAFNSEKVARAVFASSIPVIAAVGHETDFTIADFVADLRAPTPSVAAELAVPVKPELMQKCTAVTAYLHSSFNRYLETRSRHLQELSRRLVDPKKRIQDLRLRTDDYSARLIRVFGQFLRRHRERLEWRRERLYASNPLTQLQQTSDKHGQTLNQLIAAMKITLNAHRSRHNQLAARLSALSPVAILERGYSITLTIPEAKIVRDAGSVFIGQNLEILLAKGSLSCRVEGKETDGKKDV